MEVLFSFKPFVNDLPLGSLIWSGIDLVRGRRALKFQQTHIRHTPLSLSHLATQSGLVKHLAATAMGVWHCTCRFISGLSWPRGAFQNSSNFHILLVNNDVYVLSLRRIPVSWSFCPISALSLIFSLLLPSSHGCIAWRDQQKGNKGKILPPDRPSYWVVWFEQNNET